MPGFSLRRSDVQARFSVVASAVAALSLLVQTALVVSLDKGFEYFIRDGWNMTVMYGSTRRYAVLGATAMTLMLALAGFGLGLTSAGHRRNDKPRLSWIGFFLGAGVLCLATVVFAFFWLRGEPAV